MTLICQTRQPSFPWTLPKVHKVMYMTSCSLAQWFWMRTKRRTHNSRKRDREKMKSPSNKMPVCLIDWRSPNASALTDWLPLQHTQSNYLWPFFSLDSWDHYSSHNNVRFLFFPFSTFLCRFFYFVGRFFVVISVKKARRQIKNKYSAPLRRFLSVWRVSNVQPTLLFKTLNNLSNSRVWLTDKRHPPPC